VLNRNLVEGIILPERFLAVCMERGCVSAARVSAFSTAGGSRGLKGMPLKEMDFLPPMILPPPRPAQ
jgi:hypothetical protein